MPTRRINLTDHDDGFIAEQVASGRYRNASEVMRAGLRLLERQTVEEQQKLKLLRKLAAEGFHQLDQGRGIELRDAAEIRMFIENICH